MPSTQKKKAKEAKARKTNRLSGETSPYLLQHAHNPVDWYPWGPEALQRAKLEDKPILLSIGYSACHWCHVMEHESFEDVPTAQLMNEHFVNIKVDREERPDLDEIYMKAVQLMTGQGGWPMTVFLTPDLKPFFGGTYFPPDDRHGMPAFRRILTTLAGAFSEQRDKIEQSSTELSKYMELLNQLEKGEAELEHELIDKAMEKMLRVFDHQWGGFGGAPKFPQSYSLALAMRWAAPGSKASPARREECLQLVETTLNRMAYGGMHDQLGGGFARYSVDRQWLVPHFEKMLYDNASLARAYLEGFLLIGRSYWLDVARGCLDFVLRELRTPEGAFYSSLDADSEGEEGKFYVWKPEEIIDLLGAVDGSFVNEVYGVRPSGNFEHGTSVLHLTNSPEGLARRFEMSVEAFWSKLNPLKEKLLTARDKRVRPGRDEKVLTSWNALMISSLVDGYKVLKDERYLKAARDAAGFILANLCKGGRLLRTWGQGKAKLNGYLDDYAYFIQALIDLASADFAPTWLNRAAELMEVLIEHFEDKQECGLFFTSDDHEVLLTRSKNYYDGSTPSATSVAVFDLLRLGKLLDNQAYLNKARDILRIYAPYFEKAPDQFANLLCALDFQLAAGIEIALLADTANPGWKEALSLIHSVYLPNSVAILKDKGEPGGGPAKTKQRSAEQQVETPLLKGRTLVDAKPTVYVCRNYACEQPIVDIGRLEKKMQELAAAPASRPQKG